ncbi:MAG: hypothetical protein GY936_05370 [Ignavibacteriae bacterium]|nr:hypothetical protein [Ignavibacteriota bacterium]
MKKNFNKIVLILIIYPFVIFSQVINEPISNDVYSFLSTLSQKGIIEYNDLVKPLSRKYISQKLVEAENNSKDLTKLQKEELKFYFKEFGFEIENYISQYNPKSEISNNSVQETEKTKQRDILDQSWSVETRTPKSARKIVKEMALFKYDWYDRFRPFYYEGKNLSLHANPIIGYENGSWGKDNYQNILLGVNFEGYLGNFLGFNFELIQTRQSPRVRSNLYNNFSKNTTIDLQLADADRLEYATINVNIGADWEWGSFTIGKDHMNWGYAENGKVVLSEKAPSFPFVRLDIYPTEWFSFNYIHAWLNSDVVDSNSYYSTLRYRGEWENTDRFTYRSKFLVSHSVKITPFEGFDLSFGESVVYADNLQFAYLIPIMFFDLMDENLSGDDNYAGSSTQLFLAASSRNHIKNTHLYASFFADELTPENLFDPALQYYKFAFTVGGSIVDLPIDNLTLRAEFSKVYPGNYRHFIPTLTYESSSSIMGHWIGDNGDLIYGAIDYKVMRGLNIKVWGQYIRKGTEAIGNRAYKIQIPQPPFLFTDRISDRKNYKFFGFETKYEILHDLFVKAHFQYIETEQAISETKFSTKIDRDFSLLFGYGI